MRILGKSAVTIVLCGLTFGACWAQVDARTRDENPQVVASATASRKSHRKATLDKADRQRVIAAALDSKQHRRGERDCSHLVHAIYQRAGFSYPYAPSDDLYAGVRGFQRVSKPQPADLVVWHGHVGIVIRPSGHAFFSFLSTGPAVDDYKSRYWRGRGEPRFYRYVKNDACPGCTLARSQGE